MHGVRNPIVDREIYIKATSTGTVGGVEALTRKCGNFDQDLTRGHRIETMRSRSRATRKQLFYEIIHQCVMNFEIIFVM